MMKAFPLVAAPPRVLHFITHLGLGGAERVALTISRELRTTHDFAIYAAHGKVADAVGRSMRAELAELAIPLHFGTRVPMKAGGIFLAGIGAARAVARFQPNIIHLHTEIPEAAYAAMVVLNPQLAAIPLIRTIHNSVYWHHWPRLGGWCEKRMLRSHVAAVSGAALRGFEQHRAKSAAGGLPAPAVIIHNGVAESAPLTRDVRVPGPTIRLLFAGRFDEQKGSDLLPQILPLIRVVAGGELTLYGAGRQQALLRALASSPPAGWTVRMHKPVADLPAKISGYDLVIMPSRHEGLGLVAIEAMLAGVPIIATDAPGLREVLPPDHPWIAPAGNAAGFAQAVQRAIEERPIWPEVTARAAAFARQQFSLGQMCAGYRRLYAQALKKHDLPSP